MISCSMKTAAMWSNESYPVMFAVVDGTALIVDSVIEDGYDFLFNEDSCDVLYNERLDDDLTEISRLTIDCDDFEPLGKFNVSRVTDAPSSDTVGFMSASLILIEPSSYDYYPGLSQKFNYSVTDRNGNLVANGSVGDVTEIQLTGGTFVASLTIEEDGFCSSCIEGVMFSDLSIDEDVGSEYTLALSTDNELLVLSQSEITFSITGCPVGYGSDSNNYTCTVCDSDTYNIEDGFVRECLDCDPDDMNTGIHCVNGDIWITDNYWMGFNGETIISGACITNFCCWKPGGCNYVDPDDDAYRCALNRDPSTRLCSECIEGYSESVNSEQCVKCDTFFNWPFLFLPLTMAFGMSAIILLTNFTEISRTVRAQPEEDHDDDSNAGDQPSLNVDDSRRSTLKKMALDNVKKKETKLMLASLAKIVIYYEQGVSQILSANTSAIFMTAFSGIFDFSMQRAAAGVAAEDDTWCFIDNLSIKYKILADLLAPGMIFVIFGFLYLAKVVTQKRLRIKHKKLNFSAAILGVFLFIVGKIMDTLFKMLACRPLGADLTVHWYFAYDECYGHTWIVSFSCLALIVLGFSIPFWRAHKAIGEWRAHRMRPVDELMEMAMKEALDGKEELIPIEKGEIGAFCEEHGIHLAMQLQSMSEEAFEAMMRDYQTQKLTDSQIQAIHDEIMELVTLPTQNQLHFIYQLSNRFSPQYWYWEYVIFVRRVLIAWFAVGTSSAMFKLAFLFMMIFFIVLQWKIEPFSTSQTNQMEFILLICIPIVIT